MMATLEFNELSKFVGVMAAVCLIREATVVIFEETGSWILLK